MVSGRVRISVLTAEGRELSFAHAEPGAIFGEIAMLDGGVRSADATAVNKVSALSLSKPAFKRLMETHPHVADAAVRFLCSRIREADQQLEAIALYPIEGRLARFFLAAARAKVARQRGRSRDHRFADVAERARAADRRQPAEGQHGAVGAGGQRGAGAQRHARHLRYRGAASHRRRRVRMLEPRRPTPRPKYPQAHLRLQEHMRAIRARTTSPFQALKARLAAPLRPLLDSAVHEARARASDAALLRAGTAPYPPDVRRRLKILNVMCYLIATTTLLYAIQQATTDFNTYAPMVFVNLALVATVLMVPFAHRINEIAGGLLLVGAEYAALFAFTDFFSREGGAQLQYIIAAAAPFVIFGLQRIRLILVDRPARADAAHPRLVLVPSRGPHQSRGSSRWSDSLYTQAAITTVVLIAASVYYAFSLAEQAKAETDAVLRNVLPDAIVERLKANPGALIADSIEDASVMFADISGFVALTRRLGANATVDMLSRIVSEFDALAVRHGVEKIKTIGDAYMVVAGLPEPVPDHTARLARMGLDMLDYRGALSRGERARHSTCASAWRRGR